MPIIRMRAIREMSAEERKRRLTELRTELTRMRTMAKTGGAIENPSRIRDIKRAIARILTVTNEENKEARRK